MTLFTYTQIERTLVSYFYMITAIHTTLFDNVITFTLFYFLFIVPILKPILEGKETNLYSFLSQFSQ